jgi:hypothetical protein
MGAMGVIIDLKNNEVEILGKRMPMAIMEELRQRSTGERTTRLAKTRQRREIEKTENQHSEYIHF